MYPERFSLRFQCFSVFLQADGYSKEAFFTTAPALGDQSLVKV